MDNRSISWMISGGLRAETRDQRLQRVHRATLVAQDPQRDDRSWASLASAWRARLTTRYGRVDSGPASRMPDCCPA